jgi:hypothetical protein
VTASALPGKRSLPSAAAASDAASQMSGKSGKQAKISTFVSTASAPAVAAASPSKPPRAEEDCLMIGDNRKGSQGRVVKELDLYSILCDGHDPGREISHSYQRSKEYATSGQIAEKDAEDRFQEFASAAKRWMVPLISESVNFELVAAARKLGTLQHFKMPFQQQLHYAAKVSQELAFERQFVSFFQMILPADVLDVEWTALFVVPLIPLSSHTGSVSLYFWFGVSPLGIFWKNSCCTSNMSLRSPP